MQEPGRSVMSCLTRSMLPCVLLLVSGICLHAQEPTQPAKPVPQQDAHLAKIPKVVAVEFYADWCNACRALMPKFAEAKGSFQNSVLFMRFDLTNDFSKEQAAYLAAVAGLDEVYRRGNGKTGIVALVDAKSKKVLSVVGQNKTVDEIRTMLQDAIAKSE